MRFAGALVVTLALVGCEKDLLADLPDAAVVVGPDAADECTVLTDIGTLIEVTQVRADLPTPQGGTIPDGTYRLTAHTIYTGPLGSAGGTGIHESITVQIAGTHSSSAGMDNNGTKLFLAYTFAINGSSLVLMQTCPTTALQPFDAFTQVGDVVTLFNTGGNFTLEYTRNP